MNDLVLKILSYYSLLLIRFYHKDLKEIVLELGTERTLETFKTLDSELFQEIIELDIYFDVQNYLKQIEIENQQYLVSEITLKDLNAGMQKTDIPAFSLEDTLLIFDLLAKNKETYEKIYRDIVFNVETTLNISRMIKISDAKLFHLLGFDINRWSKDLKAKLVQMIPQIAPLFSESYKTLVSRNDPIFYESIDMLIEQKARLIDAYLEGDLTIPLPKIRTKNIMFERFGLIQSPTGVVLCQKDKFQETGSKLKSDTVLLREFLFGADLKFFGMGFADYGGTYYGNPIRNAETIISEDLRFKTLGSNLAGTNEHDRTKASSSGVLSGLAQVGLDDFNFRVREVMPFEEPLGGVTTGLHAYKDGVLIYDIAFPMQEIEDMKENMRATYPDLDFRDKGKSR